MPKRERGTSHDDSVERGKALCRTAGRSGILSYSRSTQWMRNSSGCTGGDLRALRACLRGQRDDRAREGADRVGPAKPDHQARRGEDERQREADQERHGTRIARFAYRRPALICGAQVGDEEEVPERVPGPTMRPWLIGLANSSRRSPGSSRTRTETMGRDSNFVDIPLHENKMRASLSSNHCRCHGGDHRMIGLRRGFTLIELLVVIAIIAIL